MDRKVAARRSKIKDINRVVASMERQLSPLASISGIDRSLEEQQSNLKLQELAIESGVVQLINSGQAHMLVPNTGQSASVCEHHICVDYHDDTRRGYRVWKWHGLILILDEEEIDYSPEYIYGQYCQPLDRAKALYGDKIDSKPARGKMAKPVKAKTALDSASSELKKAGSSSNENSKAVELEESVADEQASIDAHNGNGFLGGDATKKEQMAVAAACHNVVKALSSLEVD